MNCLRKYRRNAVKIQSFPRIQRIFKYYPTYKINAVQLTSKANSYSELACPVINISAVFSPLVQAGMLLLDELRRQVARCSFK